MKALCLVLLCLCAAGFVRAAAMPLRDFAPGKASVDARLIDALAGVDDATVRDRVRRVIREAAKPLGPDTRHPQRGYIEVGVTGARVAPNSCQFSVTVTLRRQEPDPKKSADGLVTVDRRVISGAVRPAALSLAVIVAVEEQTLALLQAAKS